MAAAKPQSTVNRLLDLAKESELFLKNAEGDAYVRGDERSRARINLSGLYHQKSDEAAPVDALSQALDILESRALLVPQLEVDPTTLSDEMRALREANPRLLAEVPASADAAALPTKGKLIILMGSSEEIEPDPSWPKVVEVRPAGIPGITGKCTAGRGFMAELHEDDRLIPIEDVLGDNGQIVYPAGEDLRQRR